MWTLFRSSRPHKESVSFPASNRSEHRRVEFKEGRSRARGSSVHVHSPLAQVLILFSAITCVQLRNNGYRSASALHALARCTASTTLEPPEGTGMLHVADWVHPRRRCILRLLRLTRLIGGSRCSHRQCLGPTLQFRYAGQREKRNGQFGFPQVWVSCHSGWVFVGQP